LKEQPDGVGPVDGPTPLADTLLRAFQAILARCPSVVSGKSGGFFATKSKQASGKLKAFTSGSVFKLDKVSNLPMDMKTRSHVHMPAKLRIVYDGAPVCLARSNSDDR
jgi:hypothetical protein